MRIPSMDGATAKRSQVSQPGGQTAGRAGSRQPGTPSIENEQEVWLKEGIEGWHNGLKA